MQVAEVIIKIFEKEGITDAFGIPGASINPVYKYLLNSTIAHYTMRHEEAAVHAADGYYRSGSRMALAICTSGPGATNFITGLYTAFIDSIPLIALTGQNTSDLLGKNAFQCVDMVSIASTICKKVVCVTDAQSIPGVLKDLFWTAKSGKPGPVLLDLPLDIQKTDISFSIDEYLPAEITYPDPDKESITKAVKLIDSSENPIIIMGGGVILSHAEQQLIEFAEYMNIPVATTYMAKGGIPDDHPLHVQHVGIQVGAASIGNEVFLASDLVLGVGCRFTDRHTGSLDVYKGRRKFIHINIEPTEINKIIPAEVGIASDAGKALKALLESIKNNGIRPKGEETIALLAAMREAKETSITSTLGKEIKPQMVYEHLNRIFDDETIWTTGCGLNQIWSGQLQKINKPRKYLATGGAGTLGFDIPAAIGASIAADNCKTVCVMGDFGFTYLVEELAVASKHDLSVVVIILNNAYLSLIRQNQKYAFNYEHGVEMAENKSFVDYVKVSEGFGCRAERVVEETQIAPALIRAKESSHPYVVEIFVENESDCSMGASIDSITNFNE